MTDDDFFANLDRSISAERGEIQAADQARQAKLAFSQAAIGDAFDVATRYRGELAKRDIAASLTQGTNGFRFEMLWPDGATHGLKIDIEPDSGTLKIQHFSTDHTDGSPYSYTEHVGDDWTVGSFETVLRKDIDSFVSLAKHHGGLI